MLIPEGPASAWGKRAFWCRKRASGVKSTESAQEAPRKRPGSGLQAWLRAPLLVLTALDRARVKRTKSAAEGYARPSRRQNCG